ncbi:MAG: spheroidene monooxygenase [Pseudomonadota bacterium]
MTLTCFRFGDIGARLIQIASMGQAGRGLSGTPGLGFGRVMGTGTGEGFDPYPDTAVWTILATWDDIRAAEDGVASAPGWARRRARAEHCCTLFMAPIRSTGRWGGVMPFEVAASMPADRGGPGRDTGKAIATRRPTVSEDVSSLPLAVLTRATVKLAHARRFWARVPAINRQIAAGPGMLFRLGMGEIPLLHQVTFSVWQDARAMRRFAYEGEGHRRAIADVRAGDWFSEELYARFAVLRLDGDWPGCTLFDAASTRVATA